MGERDKPAPLPLCRSGWSLYVHVPFCRRRCPYCDFTFAVVREVPGVAYVRAVLTELDGRAPPFAAQPLRTLYLGGGTPSLLPSEALHLLVQEVAARFGHPQEVTLEANPEDVTPATAAAWRAAGFTRVSLGVQSFAARHLRWLGRGHDAAQALAAVAHLRAAGLSNINVDLIFGLDHQDVDDWEGELRHLLDLAPPHVSLYELTVEAGTRLATWRRRGVASAGASEDLLLAMMARSEAVLAETLPAYEVSNRCQPGAHALHNLMVWQGRPYLGLGVGAHAMWRRDDGSAERWANGNKVLRYLRAPLEQVQVREDIDPLTHLVERLFVALRTRTEIDLWAWAPTRALGELMRPALERLAQQGLVHWDGQRLVATARGWRLHNALARVLMAVCDP